jgi:hypothetical protein
MKINALYSLIAASIVLSNFVMGEDVGAGHLRVGIETSSRILSWESQRSKFRHRYYVVTESDGYHDSMVSWRLFDSQGDEEGFVTESDTVKAVDVNQYCDCETEVILEKGRYCIRAFKPCDDPEQLFGWTKGYANTVKVVRVTERLEEAFWFWDHDTWTPTSRMDVLYEPLTLSTENWAFPRCGLVSDCFDIEDSSGFEFFDEEQVWESDGSCEDTLFYHTSMQKTSSEDIEGLFKLIYAPAIKESSSSTIENGFLAAANLIGSSRAKDSCFRDMALDYWCRQQYKKSASEALQYLFFVADNHESLAKIAMGGVVETIKDYVVDEVKENVKDRLGLPSFDLPSYDFVLDFWMNYFTESELKRLEYEVNAFCMN